MLLNIAYRVTDDAAGDAAGSASDGAVDMTMSLGKNLRTVTAIRWQATGE